MPQFHPYHSNLRLNGRCPVCSTPYDLNKFKILAEREQHVLTYIECGSCGAGLLSLLTVQPQGMEAVGLVTDLASDEVARFEQGASVSADDVLAMHDALERDVNVIDHPGKPQS